MATNVDFILKNGLQVGANVKVGSGYVADLNLFAPVDGMLVEGFVGIGTKSTNAPLTMAGNIKLFNSDTKGGIIFPDGTYQDTAASHAAAGVEGSIQFNDGFGSFTYDADLYWNTTNNRLGIGTSAPDAVLHVVGQTPATFNTIYSSNPTILVGSSTSDGAFLGWVSNGQSSYGTLASSTGAGPMITWTNSGVGINNLTSPVNALDVAGGAVIGSGIVYAGSAIAPTNGLLVQGSVGIGTFGTPAGKLDIRPTSGQAGILIKGPTSTPDDFLRFVDSTNADKFKVNSDGNVSVGTWQATVVKANYGGTGLSSFTAGDMLYATSDTQALSKLTIAPSGNVLLSDGSAPVWGKVSLTDAISGVLAIANGGTNGTATPTAGGVAYGDGSAYAFMSAGSSGNVLISGGAGAPTWGLNYTSSNLANTIVVRDLSGNFSAGTITAATGLVVSTGGADITGNVTATGTGTFANIVSNASISGTGLYVTTVNATSTATVNSLVSNGAVSGTTGTFTSVLSGNSLDVATGATIGGTLLANVITSNGTITATAGGVNVTGVSTFTGNVNITGALFVSGNVNSVNSNVLVVNDPLIYVAEDNPANLMDLGLVASYTTDMYRHTGLVWNHNTSTWTLFDNLITEPTETINWSQDALKFATFKAGDIVIASGTASTGWSNGALAVTGGAGISGDLNVHGNITVDGAITLSNPNVEISASKITVDNLVVSNSATVQSITSNTSVNAATGTFTSTVNATGAVTVGSLTSNGTVSGTDATFSGTLNVTQGATVNSLVSNGSVSGTTGTFSSTLTGNAVVSNSSISGVTGTFTSDVNITGSATVGSLSSNAGITGTTGSFSSTLTGSSIVSNSSISGSTGTFTSTVNATGAVTVGSLSSNGSVSGTTGSFSSTLTGSSIVSNSSISGSTGTFTSDVNITGSATVGSLSSNGSVSGTTGSFSSTLTGSSIVSNSSISGATGTFTSDVNITGSATVGSLSSNGAVSGTTGTFSSTLTGNAIVSNSSISGVTGTFTSDVNITGGATVGSLSSNGAVSGTTGTFSSTLTGNAIVSNSSISGATGTFTGAVNATGSVTVGSLSSNGAVSGTSATFSSTTTASAVVSNTTVSGNSFVIGGSVASTGGTSPLTVDTWETNKYRTVHYIAQVTDNTNAGDFQATQFMILHNDTTPFKSEYNMMWTTAPLGTFDATISGGNVTVTFTATASTNKTIKVTRTGVTV